MMRIGVGSMGVRLFTDKLVFRRLEVLGVWSLDSATPSPSAYLAHASGLSPLTTFLLSWREKDIVLT